MSTLLIFLTSYLITTFALKALIPNPPSKTIIKGELRHVESMLKTSFQLSYDTEEPGKFAGAYDYDFYFKEDEDGLWKIPLSPVHEKVITNKIMLTILEKLDANISMARTIVQLSAKYDAKHYAKTLAPAHYRNVFSQDFLKDDYNESFIDELKDLVRKAAKNDALNGSVNKSMMEDPLTSIIYKKEFMGHTVKEESRKQAVTDNREALSALLKASEPELNKVPIDEFEIVFSQNNETKYTK